MNGTTGEDGVLLAIWTYTALVAKYLFATGSLEAWRSIDGSVEGSGVVFSPNRLN